MSTIQPSSGVYLEDQVEDTVSIVEATRKSGANVDDLVDRLNILVLTLDICGWDACSPNIIQEVEIELKDIETEARMRRKEESINYFPIALLTVIILILLEKRYSLVHKIRWRILKNRKILYDIKEG
ncbi:MAG: hypothetical protein ACXAD7_20335 [Candidatus Kariarchaeaceae archaeon]|jgi:hypothetical protein